MNKREVFNDEEFNKLLSGAMEEVDEKRMELVERESGKLLDALNRVIQKTLTKLTKRGDAKLSASVEINAIAALRVHYHVAALGLRGALSDGDSKSFYDDIVDLERGALLSMADANDLAVDFTKGGLVRMFKNSKKKPAMLWVCPKCKLQNFTCDAGSNDGAATYKGESMGPACRRHPNETMVLEPVGA